jgi:hypothetical protein
MRRPGAAIALPALIDGRAGGFDDLAPFLDVARQKTEGAMRVLQPHIDSGEIKIVSHEWHDAWRSEGALAQIENALTQTHNDLKAVIANEDGLALGSLRAGLRALGEPPTDGPWAAPAVLAPGEAGDRPTGIATGPAGHGTPPEGAAFTITDRAGAPAAPLSAAGHALHDRFVAAIDDDLDMPVALALQREILRAPLPADERRWLVLDADMVLGLDLHRVWEGEVTAREEAPIPADVQALADARTAARAERDWARADALRGELEALGWVVVDGPDGSRLRRRGLEVTG